MRPAPRPAWIDRIEEQLAELQDLGRDVFVGLPATDEAISSFESALGLLVPTSYRELVTTYGWLELGELAILGLERAEVQTLAARATHRLPELCIVVHIVDGTGALLCLDTSPPRTDGESALVRFEPAGHSLASERTTLVTWLSELVAAQLQLARGDLA